jgi:hypothetical protein
LEVAGLEVCTDFRDFKIGRAGVFFVVEVEVEVAIFMRLGEPLLDFLLVTFFYDLLFLLADGVDDSFGNGRVD